MDGLKRWLRRAGRSYYYDPFVTWLGMAAMISGGAYIAGGPKPGTVEALLPHYFVAVWQWFLLLGGSLLLLGLFAYRRLFIAGLCLLSSGLTIYVIAVVGIFHAGGALAALSVGVLAIGCATRAVREWLSWGR